jgi:hypothetical protein
MSNTQTNPSAAMGFWTRHREAMEAFEYEDDETPPAELREIFSDAECRAILNAILNRATDVGNDLVHAIANAIDAEWMRHSTLVVERRRKSTTWEEKFLVRRKWSRKSKRTVEIGVSIETADTSDLHLFCYLWTKGGKKAAIFNAECVRRHHVPTGEWLKNEVIFPPPTGYWGAGVMLLAQIRLVDFLVGECLDVMAVEARAIAQISRCSGAAIEEILNALE